MKASSGSGEWPRLILVLGGMVAFRCGAWKRHAKIIGELGAASKRAAKSLGVAGCDVRMRGAAWFARFAGLLSPVRLERGMIGVARK